MSSPHEDFRSGNRFAHYKLTILTLIDICIITLISDEMSAQNEQISRQIQFLSN